ncbi:hypothetical protein M3650_25275 [Paenibacillus sp. MER TA 81-3]|uniref:hypothetical protein n=1 Tax=Paenibacillus sp. MER TA 81-3 TaxID=2939573 RepID=UPI00203BB487|nr:hypothetical protein [Paenibacillus sp. MER TA 81-3]MCM3341847.1 hypothetical protein [Paenibacillus sp. MER TA 81-3]
MPEREERKRLEAELSGFLTEGEMETEDQDAAVRRRLAPRTEIRIQTSIDPIVEETARYRKMAKEVDDRYDGYLSRVNDKKKTDE